jgi:hypothetical protein
MTVMPPSQRSVCVEFAVFAATHEAAGACAAAVTTEIV